MKPASTARGSRGGRRWPPSPHQLGGRCISMWRAPITLSAATRRRKRAAEALEVSRTLAAFHLDKLVEAGLLETSYRRLGERQGPGAGRPAKLNQRSHQALEVSFPERQYELAGEALARALEAGKSPLPLVEREGRRLGEETTRRLRPAEAGAAGTSTARAAQPGAGRWRRCSPGWATSRPTIGGGWSCATAPSTAWLSVTARSSAP